MTSATYALQKAIFSALDNDSTLKAQITGVYDALPVDTTFPYVVIGEDTEIAWNGLTRIGRECTTTIHVFSRAHGMSECKQIAGHVIDLLERASLSADGFTVITSILDLCQFVTDTDGITKHGVIRMRFRVA